MKNMTALRPAISLGIVLGLTLAALQPLSAQGSRENVESGRRYAISWCSECHSVVPNTVRVFAADFADSQSCPRRPPSR